MVTRIYGDTIMRLARPPPFFEGGVGLTVFVFVTLSEISVFYDDFSDLDAPVDPLRQLARPPHLGCSD